MDPLFSVAHTRQAGLSTEPQAWGVLCDSNGQARTRGSPPCTGNAKGVVSVTSEGWARGGDSNAMRLAPGNLRANCEGKESE